MGEFNVTSYQPSANVTLYISFHLFGTIECKNSGDIARCLRHHGIVVVRGAKTSDLTHAGLGLIKSRILETSIATLGQPLLQGIVFSQFSWFEQ